MAESPTSPTSLASSRPVPFDSRQSGGLESEKWWQARKAGKAAGPAEYQDYLNLEKVLNAQHPRSKDVNNEVHDEMLFIIIHQTYELWFKQIIHELNSVIDVMNTDFVESSYMSLVVKRLDRVTKIFKVLVQQFDILETMTPLDFLDFRDYLIPASGFQSGQFRQLECKMGLNKSNRLTHNNACVYAALAQVEQDLVTQAEGEANMLQVVDKWLSRLPLLSTDDGFDFVAWYQGATARMLERDAAIIESMDFSADEKKQQLDVLDGTRENLDALFNQEKYDQHVAQKRRSLSRPAMLASIFISIYRDEPLFAMPFRVLENLVEFEEQLTFWRTRHATMVHRMIGKKIGTGGSSGHAYLRSTIEHHKIFGDLFDAATFLVPRSVLPQLPPQVIKHLQDAGLNSHAPPASGASTSTRSFADTASSTGLPAAKPQAQASAAPRKCPYNPHAAAAPVVPAGYSASHMIAFGLTTAAVTVMVVGSLLRSQK